MKRIISCLFFLGISLVAYCGNLSRIVLTDGSVIQAEVVSYENGVYTLRAGSLGEIKLEEAKIRKVEVIDSNIKPSDKVSEATNIEAIRAEAEKLRPKITGNRDIMNTVEGLRNDPQFQDTMNDPEILNAVESDDYLTLMTNEKFKKLMEHPKVKEIGDK